MKSTAFTTPILLLVFNRPDYLTKMIALLAELKPSTIYVSGDGPRTGNATDEIACKEVQAALELITWKCEVFTHFSPKNLGCKVSVSNGISWFFNNVPEGIILEDDCLADLSFFSYAEELLKKYRDDESVGLIAGSNPLGKVPVNESYFFSVFPFCWGWASWRRAWNNYDVKMEFLPKDGEEVLQKTFSADASLKYWTNILNDTYHGKIDTWDYQWMYCCWKFGMKCILPAQNLVQNIGFDPRATHTKLAFSPLAFQKKYALSFPLKHPSKILTNKSVDREIAVTVFEKNKYLKLASGVQKQLGRLGRLSDRMTPWTMPDTSVIIIKPQPKWYLLDLPELWKFRELFMIFAWRDIKVRYKQTFVGVGWVIFQPLINTIIFTVFFGNFAHISSGTLPYPLFVLLGLIYWTFFSTSLSHAANSFVENTAILGKVYFPREILPLSSIAVGLIDFLVSTILFIPLAIFYHAYFSVAFLAMVLIGLVITVVSSAGLGLLLASINVKYRDVRYILPYFLQMMIFVTPVIYPLGIMRPSLQTIVSLNPMTGVIEGLRSSLATGQITNWNALTIAFFSSLALFLLGVIYFRKTQAFFADLL